MQFYEGNCWLLVNRQNGKRKYIGGIPFISKDKKKIIAENVDLEAGYSFNGLEMLTVGNSIATDFEKATTFGPANVKWIDEHRFLMRREFFHINEKTSRQENTSDYRLVTIRKKP